MSGGPHTVSSGPIAWMSRNAVAANLLMIVVLVGGLVGALRIKQEVFPSFDPDVVNVSVVYPGASPAEVEQAVILAIEEAVQGVDGVKRVTSTAQEGVGAASIEVLLDADPDRVLADVKTEVDRIRSFPIEAERPSVVLASRRQRVVSLVLSGDQDWVTLHRVGEQARRALLARDGVTQVELQGLPPLEVSVEIPRETLRSYGLTLEGVAAQIAASSIELPGGGIKTRGGELLVRVSQRRKAGYQFEDVVLRGTSSGAQVRLGEIASIRDGFADTDQASYYNGKPAVRLTAYRVGAETPASVSRVVRDYQQELRASLPSEIELAIWDDDSEILDSRISLLVRNGTLGLGLVFLALALFLDLRLASWVSAGIAVSFLGTFLLMPLLGISVNMISLFALIVTIGLVVDDAIVVGENIFDMVADGADPLVAASEGAQEMAVPVTFSVLTTMAAFIPLAFVPGTMGKIWYVIPAVVCSVLLFSLLESFFILPAHLAHSRGGRGGAVVRAAGRVQRVVARGLAWQIEHLYTPTLRAAIAWRYLTISIAAAAFTVALALVVSGLLPFRFFPKLEGDVVTATVRLPYGAPVARTREVAALMEQAAQGAVEASGETTIVRGIYTRVGEGPPGHFGVGRAVGGHLATVEIQLVPGEDRATSAKQFGDLWYARIPSVAGVEVLTVNSAVGPGAAAAVNAQLTHSDEAVLAEASEAFAHALRAYPSLTNIENTWTAGKPQLDLRLNDNAHTLGLTGMDVARQIRASFYGAEALREQRQRNEIRVMVRLPESQRQSEYDLEQIEVRTPTGGFVPLSTVAQTTRGTSPTAIVREDGRKIVNVKAELAPGVRSPREVLDAIRGEVMPALETRYPGLDVDFVGQQRDQAETFGALGRNYLIAMFVIYAMLAIPFKSYTQPLIVMSAIPLGFVGAVVGHLLLGYELSIISMLGTVALSGVVVNDSLVLIDATNQYRARGLGPMEAIMAGGVRRFRPILLTSVTTFFGLVPMILETSVQARFLIPMAIALGFGVLFATFVTLLVVPALYLILEDAHRLAAWLGASREPKTGPEPAK